MRRKHALTTGATLARLLLDPYGAGTVPASTLDEHPSALRLPLVTGLVYGDSQEQRATAPTAADPLTLPWINGALAQLQELLVTWPASLARPTPG